MVFLSAMRIFLDVMRIIFLAVMRVFFLAATNSGGNWEGRSTFVGILMRDSLRQ
jgi:hypothetical protein